MSLSERQRRISERMRACQPGKQEASKREIAAEAQVALHMAWEEVAEDPMNAAWYLQTGVPRMRHECERTASLCKAIEEAMNQREACLSMRQRSLLDFFPSINRSRPRASPPDTPRAGTSTSLTDEESSDGEEVQFLEYVPPPEREPLALSPAPAPALRDNKRASSGSPETAPPKKRTRGPFQPGPQHQMGATIVKRVYAAQGPFCLVGFDNDQAKAEWLTEEETAEHFPQACRVYLANLMAGDQEALTEVLRSAGPISALLD